MADPFDFSGMELLFGGPTAELEQVQQPVRRPAPVPRPSPYGAPPQRRALQPRPRRQRQAAPPVIDVKPEVISETPAQPPQGGSGVNWFDLMRKSGISSDQFPVASDYIINKTDNPNTAYPSTLPPAAKQSLDAYWEAVGRDDILNVRQQRATPSAPAQQDRSFSAPAAPAQPQAAPAPETDFSGMELLFGDQGDKQPQAAPQQPAPVTPDNTGTNAGNWITGAYNYVTGADRDPQHRDVQGFTGYDLPFDPKTASALNRSQLFGATDAQYADVIEKQLGKNFIRRFKDQNGAELIEFKGPDGQPVTRYINEPGADLEDLNRGIAGVFPYIAAGGLVGNAMRGAGTVGHMVGQGLTAAGVSLAGDAANQGEGSLQPVDPWKAGTVGLFAGGAQGLAPAVGALYRKFVAEPRLFNKATGQLTDAGKQAAVEAGIDPGQMTQVMARSFSKAMAKTNDAKRAGVQIMSGEFDVPTTLGQRTNNIRQLTDEGVIRYGGYGDDAAKELQRFDTAQAQAIKEAALGDGGANAALTGAPPKASIARTLDPDFTGADTSPGFFGTQVQSGVRKAHAAAKGKEKEAWEAVKDIVPSMDALKKIGGIVDEARYVTGISADEIGTPTALRMIDRLDDFMTGNVNKVEGLRGRASQVPKTVDGVRRQLSNMLADAQTPTDRKLAGALYERYNDWIRKTAEQGLLSGDNDAAAALFKAVDISRDLNRVFRPSGNPSQKAASKIIQKMLDDSVTPERLIDDLLGSSFSTAPKAGVKETLASIKAGLKGLSDESANQTWNAIRVAHWARIVKNKSGDLVGPQAMQSNLKAAFEKQGSIMRQLYTSQEIAQIRKFQGMLDKVVAPVVNPSGSGLVGVAQARRGVADFLGSFSRGPMGRFVTGLLESTIGRIVKDTRGNAAVAKALSQRPPRAAIPTLGGYGGGLGGLIERQPKLNRNSQRAPAR